ncbi:hypothetical protein Hanom_Chr17g01538331 [Helianthus anomalus]
MCSTDSTSDLQNTHSPSSIATPLLMSASYVGILSISALRASKLHLLGGPFTPIQGIPSIVFLRAQHHFLCRLHRKNP